MSTDAGIEITALFQRLAALAAERKTTLYQLDQLTIPVTLKLTRREVVGILDAGTIEVFSPGDKDGAVWAINKLRFACVDIAKDNDRRNYAARVGDVHTGTQNHCVRCCSPRPDDAGAGKCEACIAHAVAAANVVQSADSGGEWP